MYILQRSCAVKDLTPSSYLIQKNLVVYVDRVEARFYAEQEASSVLVEIPRMDLPSSEAEAMHKLSEALNAVTAKHPQNYNYLGTDRSANEYSTGLDQSADVREYYRTPGGKVVKVNTEVKNQILSKQVHKDALAFSKRVLEKDGRGSFFKKYLEKTGKKAPESLYKGTQKTGEKTAFHTSSEEKKLSYYTQ